MGWRPATGVAVGTLFGAIAWANNHQSGAYFALTVAAVGGIALLFTIKLWPGGTRWSDDWWERLPPILVGLFALIDGVGALLGAEPFADWSIGIWSLPLGVLVLSAEVVDLRRPASPPRR